MKRALGVLLSFVFVLVMVGSVFANAPGINRRQHRDQRRIHQGIRNGELTRREAARLEAQQARIRAAERRARADGHITPRDRYRINRRLNHANRNIYRQKHDRQDRP
jgi:hypothetical protein